jgi:Uma2 family endonuclease
MRSRTSEYLDAIDHLPPGATLTIPGSWDDYEDLLNDRGDRPALRVSYNEGKLEVMTPLPEHEAYKEVLADLARAFADENGLLLEKRGSTTWKRRSMQKGVEPDTCFYVANASRIAGKRTIDLESDPPPDIVVEIDITNESLGKFSIYAALGVPEIWRYDATRVQMYRLASGSYLGVDASSFLTGLTSALLTEFLDVSKAETQTRTLQMFRERLRALRAT